MNYPKPRQCKAPGCDLFFIPFLTTQKACSIACARAISQAAIAKQIRKQQLKAKREGRERLKTRRDYEREAQRAFNAYIRERDYAQPCISCGRYSDAKRNAGHYLSVGSHPELRFDEDNCHAQCEHCNTYKSGNAVAYRMALIARIGRERVESLEGPRPAARRSTDDLKAIRKDYQIRARVLREQRSLCA